MALPRSLRHPWKSLAARVRRRRLDRIRAKDPLREFVYIDATSLYSLMAARIGAVPSEYLDTSSSYSKRTLNGKGMFDSLPGNPEASFGFERSATATYQVTRKSSLQALFRDFYQREEQLLLTTPSLQRYRRKNHPAQVTGLQHLKAESSIGNGWVVAEEQLRRGTLVEFQVTLSTDNIYKIASTGDTLARLIRESPKVFGFDLLPSMEEVQSIIDVLQKLMVGLIPIRAEVRNYRVVDDAQGNRFIAHTSALEKIPGVRSQPFDLVGVVEPELFWKDIRRCLYSDQEFSVFARVESNGLRPDWIPVKLAEALKDAVPSLPQDLRTAANAAIAEFAGASTALSAAASDLAIAKAQAAAISHFASTLSLEDSDGFIGFDFTKPFGNWTNVTDRRADFNRALGEEVRDPAAIASARETALLSCGFNSAGEFIETDHSSSILPLPQRDVLPMNQHVLEAEIVAIYW